MIARVYFGDVFASDELITRCREKANRVVVITDSNIEPHYAIRLLTYLQSSALQCDLITIPAGEHSKSRAMKMEIEDKLFSLGCGRDTVLIALGGGVITDLTGFVAATYLRGIPVIYIPTSLLAMVDAAHGGKTGINTPFGKNNLGTFTQPAAIFIDVLFLKTLPQSEYQFAFAEIIKHALILDADYFTYLISHLVQIENRDPDILWYVIKRSVELKCGVIIEDAREKSKREILNFGHTIGHALESVSAYTMQHGHAVAIGMLVESQIARDMGLLDQKTYEHIHASLQAFHLLQPLDFVSSKNDVMHALQFDKKSREGALRFVLLNQVGAVWQQGDVVAHAVDPLVLNRAIDTLFQQYFPASNA